MYQFVKNLRHSSRSVKKSCENTAAAIRIFLSVVMLAAAILLFGCSRADGRNIVYEDMKESFDKSGMISANIGIFSKTEKAGNITYGEGGSGVIFRKDGDSYYALTAAHVVSVENAKLLVFTVNTEMKAEDIPGAIMNVIAPETYDAMYTAQIEYVSTRDDLAVIRFSTDEELAVINVAETDPEKDDRILCIGNPQNEWFALSYGKVASGIEKFGELQGFPSYVMRHSAYIQVGSSGGAALNEQMQLAGIVPGGVFSPGGDKLKYGVLIPTSEIRLFLEEWGKETENRPLSPSYEELIFDTSRVHTIEVTLSEEDRADQLAHPMDKTKYRADVVIDGEEVKDVAFHTKGNSSLFFTVDAGKDKFSYGLNFGKFTDGGTFYGLDKLDLQNNFADGSSIKEYMAFWLFRRMGVNAPLASYVWLTVNGEVQGLYTALEDVGNSFLERIAGGEGTIYKPEAGGIALDEEELERIKRGESAAHDSDGGADLVYRGDNADSYPDIFDNAETDEDEQTHARVIGALKALSEKKDLDQYLDTEEIIKYFAVHDFLVCYDSYTGPMLHNYCLHESGGRLAMLPWDYDNSFGSFPADARLGNYIDSKDVVNAGIDSPLGIIADEDRPMWNWILSNEAYLDKYHDVLSELVDVISSGEYEKEASRVHELIHPYIVKDPKAFFSEAKSEKAYATVISFAKLRAESVRRQVSGELAARSDDQTEEDKVDASEVAIKDMGTLDDLKEP